MKNKSKRAIMNYMRYLMIVPLMGWSLSSVMAADPKVAPPPPVTTPVVEPDKTDTDAASGKTSPAKDEQRVKQLAATYGVTEHQVLTMRQTDHMGWGEIKNLLLISKRVSENSTGTDKPITSDQALGGVLKQRQSGMGIGQIANSHNIKLGDLQSGDKPAKSEKIAKPDKPEKPEKIAKPDKPEKPEKIAKPDKPERPSKPMSK